MPWTFEQSTGRLLRPDGTLAGVGYAGRGPGRNNAALQAVKNTGPIPQGLYYRGEAVKHPKMGPVCIPLRPDPNNRMFKRDSFYVHGDNAVGDASHGCPVLPRSARLEFANSPDPYLRVVSGDAKVSS